MITEWTLPAEEAWRLGSCGWEKHNKDFIRYYDHLELDYISREEAFSVAKQMYLDGFFYDFVDPERIWPGGFSDGGEKDGNN